MGFGVFRRERTELPAESRNELLAILQCRTRSNAPSRLLGESINLSVFTTSFTITSSSIIITSSSFIITTFSSTITYSTVISFTVISSIIKWAQPLLRSCHCLY